MPLAPEERRERNRLANERARRKRGITPRPRIPKLSPEDRLAYDRHMARIRDERYRRKRGQQPIVPMTPAQRHNARLQTLARYRINKPASIKASQRRCRALHPEAQQTYVRRRRARLAGVALNDYSAAQWREQQALQNHRCYYCGKRCKGRLTMDHILAVVDKGPTTASNIIAVCQSCNSKKGTKPPPIPVQMTLLTLAPPKKRKAS